MQSDDWNTIKEIPGLLLEGQEEALYELAGKKPKGPMVEIGVYLGRSSTCLLLGSKEEGCLLHVFDIFYLSTRQQYEEKMKPLSDRLFIHHGDSKKILDSECPDGVALAFIDGDHTREGAKNDADICLRKLMSGGLLIMHDVIDDDDKKGVWQTWWEIEGILENKGSCRTLRWGYKK